MKSLRWFAIEAGVTVSSAVIGWALPDGLNALARLTGSGELDVTPTERFLSALVVFMFATSLQLLFALREESAALERNLPLKVQQRLDSSLLRLFLDSVGERPDNARSIEESLSKALALLTRGSPDLLDARAVILHRALANATNNVSLLAADGLEMNIQDNNAVTRKLASGSSRYRQIQRRAFRVPDEWTRAWQTVVDQLGYDDIDCEYVVVMPREHLEQDHAKLESMDTYMRERGWRFRVCDVQDILDALGGMLPTEANFEIFDDRLVKVQQVPAGAYQGGVVLRVAIYDLDARPDFKVMDDAISRYAKPYAEYASARS